jgi:serine/threonine-protein kinase HipA
METGTGLKLNISDSDNALNLDLAMEVHIFFRLTEARAYEIIEMQKNIISSWRKVASQYGISKAEQELKSSAFQQTSY